MRCRGRRRGGSPCPAALPPAWSGGRGGSPLRSGAAGGAAGCARLVPGCLPPPPCVPPRTSAAGAVGWRCVRSFGLCLAGGSPLSPPVPFPRWGKGKRPACGVAAAGRGLLARLCRAGLLTKKRGKSRAKAISSRSCSPTVAPSRAFYPPTPQNIFILLRSRTAQIFRRTPHGEQSDHMRAITDAATKSLFCVVGGLNVALPYLISDVYTPSQHNYSASVDKNQAFFRRFLYFCSRS